MRQIVAAVCVLGAAECMGAQSGLPVPQYDLRVTLRQTRPRLSGEAVITLPSNTSDSVTFALGQHFRVLSVELREGSNFVRASRVDSVLRPHTRAGWGTVSWTAHGRAGAPATVIRVRYALDSAATAFVFGVSDDVVFGSGINTAWYPQIEEGTLSPSGRPRTLRSIGVLAFDLPQGFSVYTSGMQRAGRYHITKPAWFTFAAARYHVSSREAPNRRLPAATYFLKPRASSAEYTTKALQVLEVLEREFGPYPFDRFAIVEVPAELADRAGFAGASTDGCILATPDFLDQQFNSAYYGHEIGHLWWGVTVRTSGARGAWMLSEGMAQYGGLRAVEAIDGAAAAEEFRRNEHPGYLSQGGRNYFRTVAAGHDAPLADLPLDAQWSRDIVDSKGFMAWHALSQEIGAPVFQSALNAVVRDYNTPRVAWETFLEYVSRASGSDLSWFYAQWFARTGAPELSAELEPGRRAVLVRQSGDIYRLTVDLALAGPGCPRRYRTQIAQADQRVPLPPGCRADSVTIDPEYHVLRWTPELRAEFPIRNR
jgi:hypothetical protein